MHKNKTSAFLCIKSNSNNLVKLMMKVFFFIMANALIGSFPAWSSEPSLPNIEARSYPIKTVKKSRSGKIYLFEDPTGRQPPANQIFLLKKGEENVMAFQVLRNYPEKHTFAAKRIKRYNSVRVLDNGTEYRAYEKKADLPTPHLSPEKDDKAQKFDGDVPSYDPDIDKKPIVRPKVFDSNLDQINESDKKKTLNSSPEVITDSDKLDDPSLTSKLQSPSKPVEDESLEDSSQDSIEEEHSTLDPYDHWLSVGFGYVANSAPTSLGGGSHFFSAGDLHYGIRIKNQPYLNLPHLQDSIVLEGGVYFYKALNFVTVGDAYNLLAFTGVLRYNVFFSEKFALFGYAGIIKNSVTSAVQPDSNTISLLSSTRAAAGLGLLLQVGPSWYARVNVGIESIGLGLVLRF